MRTTARTGPLSSTTTSLRRGQTRVNGSIRPGQIERARLPRTVMIGSPSSETESSRLKRTLVDREFDLAGIYGDSVLISVDLERRIRRPGAHFVSIFHGRRRAGGHEIQQHPFHAAVGPALQNARSAEACRRPGGDSRSDPKAPWGNGTPAVTGKPVCRVFDFQIQALPAHAVSHGGRGSVRKSAMRLQSIRPSRLFPEMR